jgi:hypothetical protein
MHGYDMKLIPRQTYGYLHWKDRQGLICLRNPWMQMDKVELVLNEEIAGIDQPIADYSAIQIYPYPRCISKGLKYGDKLPVKMGPYETKLIKLTRDTATIQPQPDPLDEQFHQVTLAQTHSNTKDNRWKSTIEAETADKGWQLYYLLEADQPFKTSDVKAAVDNQPAKPHIIDSESGWSATLLKKPRYWQWFVLDVPQGQWKADMHLGIDKGPVSGIAWLVRSFDPPISNRQNIEEPEFPTPPNYKAQISKKVIKKTTIQMPDMKK